MVLVKATDNDFTESARHLEETVLPNWAERVDQKWVDRWNATVGEITGLSASK
jgi:hypothetical protein